MATYYSRRNALSLLTALGLGAGVSTGSAGAKSDTHDDGGPTLNRLATTVRGAEITGMFLTNNGRFFFNIQHPSGSNEDPFDKGTLGALTGVDLHDLPSDFGSVPVPDEGDMTTVHTAAGEYQPLANGGDETDDGEGLGIPYSSDGNALTSANNPDFNGFVPADHPNEGYLFSNWEARPGMVSRLHLRMKGRRGNSQNHQWEVLGSENVDFRDVEGTWTNCFGTVSPWGTPLTSEEYEPNARNWFRSGSGADAMSSYLGRFANAYRYGYIVEIEEPTGDPEPVKHFTMGRFSHENSVVMPDEKTAYMSDDGTGTVFFKFVADEAGDLSAGTLYAAQATQDDSTDVAATGFDLDWIELAHGTDEQIESWIAEYDDQEPGPDADYVTDAEVDEWANGNADDDRAAFLESRAAAAAVGATDEFRKMEGVNIRRDAVPGDYLYMAMSNTNATMADGQGDIAIEGDSWGAIYRMELDNEFDVERMEPVITGGPEANICGGCPYDARPDSASTVCEDCAFNPMPDEEDEEKGIVGRGLERMSESFESAQPFDPETTISEPDNVVVMDDGRVVIGEDTSNEGHDPPNMIWIYDPGDGERGPAKNPGRGRGRGRP